MKNNVKASFTTSFKTFLRILEKGVYFFLTVSPTLSLISDHKRPTFNKSKTDDC